MTKFVFIAVLFISSISFSQETANVGVFEFETEVIDYGNIAQNADGKRVFAFKNIGSSPIIIKSVKASCGCTIPSKPEKAVLPGEAAEIEVTYDTKRVGGFSKTITIISNANEERKVVRIMGNVIKKDKIASALKN